MSASVRVPSSAVRTPTGALVEVDDLKCHFALGGGWFGRSERAVRAVDGVSFVIRGRETLGLVGESGCGKSTLGRAIVRLVDPTAGAVRFEGRDITRLSRAELRQHRRRMQMIFQDPYSALNPRMTVRAAIAEPMHIHALAARGEEQEQRVVQLLERVGLGPEHMHRYPHEFSGGQRQRIGIARALAAEPRFLVADEPVSALDVSVQAQICNLLKDLSEELGLSYLFIAHDLNVVEFMSQRVAVMYLGRIAELAPASCLYQNPRHPYTKALLGAVPVPDPKRRRGRLALTGDVPSPVDPPAGCAFHPRCPVAERGVCDREIPTLRELQPGHRVSCHLAE